MADIEKIESKIEEAVEIADKALEDAAGGIRDHNQFRPSGVVNGVVPGIVNGVVNGVVPGIVLGDSEEAHTQGVVLDHSDKRENC